MDIRRPSENAYLGSALTEALKVIQRDHGADFVDRLVEEIFRQRNIQEAFLDEYDDNVGAEMDKYGRAAITIAVESAKRNPRPLI